MFSRGTVKTSDTVTVSASPSDDSGDTCSVIFIDFLLLPRHSTLLSRRSSRGPVMDNSRAKCSAQRDVSAPESSRA